EPGSRTRMGGITRYELRIAADRAFVIDQSLVREGAPKKKIRCSGLVSRSGVRGVLQSGQSSRKAALTQPIETHSDGRRYAGGKRARASFVLFERDDRNDRRRRHAALQFR